jgi:hypothetical protein
MLIHISSQVPISHLPILLNLCKPTVKSDFILTFAIIVPIKKYIAPELLTITRNETESPG